MTAKEKTAGAAERTSHPNIYAALSAFQGELKPIPKTREVEFATKTGGKVKFKYTPLGEIMETIYPMLGKHGLSLRHEVVKEGPVASVIAILTHETYQDEYIDGDSETERDAEGTSTTSSEKIRVVRNEIRSGPVTIPVGGDIKDTGAGITYARRYSATMILGIASEDDTDAALFMASAENAMGFAEGKARQAIDNAKNEKELNQAMEILTKDLATLQKGKAPALGLKKEQYEALIAHGEAKRKEITKVTVTPENES